MRSGPVSEVAVSRDGEDRIAQQVLQTYQAASDPGSPDVITGSVAQPALSLIDHATVGRHAQQIGSYSIHSDWNQAGFYLIPFFNLILVSNKLIILFCSNVFFVKLFCAQMARMAVSVSRPA